MRTRSSRQLPISGVGADTISLYRTIDGGQSWHPYQNGFGGATESRAVFSLAALPGDPGVLLATGGAAVVAKSDDLGRSWRKVWGDWQLGAVGTHFVIAEAQYPALLWAGGEGGYFQPLLLKSTNSGESWQEIWLYPYFFGLGVSRVSPSRVYASGARQGLPGDLRELTLYRSQDAGHSWVTSSNGSVRGGVRALLIWSQTGEPERILLGTGDGLWQFTPTP